MRRFFRTGILIMPLSNSTSSHLRYRISPEPKSSIDREDAQTLVAVAPDPKHTSAEIGLISILHTWGQNLLLHPNVHCASPAGGLSPDHSHWKRPSYPFFLPVKVLSRVFCGKLCAGLKRLYRRKRVLCAGLASALANPKQFDQLLRRVHRQGWVVYGKSTFGGPIQVLRYLGRIHIGSPPPITGCWHLMAST